MDVISGVKEHVANLANHGNNGDSPHRRRRRIVQSYSPGGGHMYCRLLRAVPWIHAVTFPAEGRHLPPAGTKFYRTVGVVTRLEARSVTRDNAQLSMLREPCSCWPVAASVGSGH